MVASAKVTGFGAPIESLAASPAHGGVMLAGTSRMTGNQWTGEVHLFALGGGRPVRVADKPTGFCTTPQTAAATVWAGADDAVVAAAADDGVVYLWRCVKEASADGAEVLQLTADETLTEHMDSVLDLAPLPSQRTILLSASADASVKLWDLASLPNGSLETFEGHYAPVWSVEWLPGSTSCFSAVGQDGALVCFDRRTMRSVLSQRLPEPVFAQAWSPTQEHTVALGTEAGHIMVLDQRKVTEPILHDSKTHSNAVQCLAFSPDGARLAAGSDDASLSVRGTKDLAAEPLVIKAHTDFCRALAWRENSLLLSGGWDQALWAHDLA